MSLQELIAILRHLLPNHRTAMLGHVDELLDERVLLGVGLTGRESLRYVPFYYHGIVNLTGL